MVSTPGELKVLKVQDPLFLAITPRAAYQAVATQTLGKL